MEYMAQGLNEEMRPAYPRKRSRFLNMVGYLGFLASSLFGGENAYSGTTYHTYRDSLGNTTRVKIECPDRVIGRGKVVVTVEKDNRGKAILKEPVITRNGDVYPDPRKGLSTVAVAIGIPDESGDIVGAKLYKKHGEVWGSGDERYLGGLGLIKLGEVGEAVMKVAKEADKALKKVYGERFKKDAPPGFFSDKNETTGILFTQPETIGIAYKGEVYTGARFEVDVDFFTDSRVRVWVWGFDINDMFDVKYEGQTPKEARKPVARTAGKSKLSDLARVDADGWIYPNGVDRNPDGSYKYDFSDKEQVLLALTEAISNSNVELFKKVLSTRSMEWIKHGFKKEIRFWHRRPETFGYRDLLPKLEIGGIDAYVKFVLDERENPSIKYKIIKYKVLPSRESDITQKKVVCCKYFHDGQIVKDEIEDFLSTFPIIKEGGECKIDFFCITNGFRWLTWGYFDLEDLE